MDDGDAKSFLPRDEAARQHSPRSLRVANSVSSSISVNGLGKLNAAIQNLRRERLWEKYSTGLAVSLATRAVGDKRPVLQKDPSSPAFAFDFTGSVNWRVVPSRATFVNNLESTFKSDEIAPAVDLIGGQSLERFGPAARPGHQFGAARWRVGDSTQYIDADNLEPRTGIQLGSDGA
jgi:hypothetical protein